MTNAETTVCCKNCKHGNNLYLECRFLTQCDIGSFFGQKPEFKEQDDSCPYGEEKNEGF